MWCVLDDTWEACRCEGAGGKKAERRHASLRQRQEDVLHQHGADHHLLTVDRQLGGSFLFGRHGDQHQAAAGHRPACEPVDRMIRRRNRRTEVRAAEIGRSKVKMKPQKWRRDKRASVSRRTKNIMKNSLTCLMTWPGVVWIPTHDAVKKYAWKLSEMAHSLICDLSDHCLPHYDISMTLYSFGYILTSALFFSFTWILFFPF